jgi:hypothetical protein
MEVAVTPFFKRLRQDGVEAFVEEAEVFVEVQEPVGTMVEIFREQNLSEDQM